MRTGLAPEFSRASFESDSDPQGLCARLARALTGRVRAATDLHMEIESIVANLRSVGHDVQWWDAVIANWDGRKQGIPYLWVTLQGVDTLNLSSNGPDDIAGAEVTVSFPAAPTTSGRFQVSTTSTRRSVLLPPSDADPCASAQTAEPACFCLSPAGEWPSRLAVGGR